MTDTNPSIPLSGYRTKKRLGQHFLRDRRILTHIIDAAELGPDDFVLEIGPGEGDLTAAIAAQAGQVLAVELDDDLIPHLQARFAHTPNVTIWHRDILAVTRAELNDFIRVSGPRKVVANIPYYITSPILMNLLDEDGLRKHGPSPETAFFERILIMIQKEVADRLLAKAGTKDFGSLSVICQYGAEISQVAFVSRLAFKPPPKVDSMVVQLKPRSLPPVMIEATDIFWRLVRTIYTSRRKTLRNSLRQGGFSAGQIGHAEEALDLQRRGETLGLAELASLAGTLARGN